MVTQMTVTNRALKGKSNKQQWYFELAEGTADVQDTEARLQLLPFYCCAYRCALHAVRTAARPAGLVLPPVPRPYRAPKLPAPLLFYVPVCRMAVVACVERPCVLLNTVPCSCDDLPPCPALHGPSKLPCTVCKHIMVSGPVHRGGLHAVRQPVQVTAIMLQLLTTCGGPRASTALSHPYYAHFQSFGCLAACGLRAGSILEGLRVRQQIAQQDAPSAQWPVTPSRPTIAVPRGYIDSAQEQRCCYRVWGRIFCCHHKPQCVTAGDRDTGDDMLRTASAMCHRIHAAARTRAAVKPF